MESKINEWILKSGYKKKHLANELEVSQEQLSRWISMKSYPPLKKAFKLSRLLGCTVEDLWIYDEIKKSPTHKE